jgi:hypothetical protein
MRGVYISTAKAPAITAAGTDLPIAPAGTSPTELSQCAVYSSAPIGCRYRMPFTASLSFRHGR